MQAEYNAIMQIKGVFPFKHLGETWYRHRPSGLIMWFQKVETGYTNAKGVEFKTGDRVLMTMDPAKLKKLRNEPIFRTPDPKPQAILGKTDYAFCWRMSPLSFDLRHMVAM